MSKKLHVKELAERIEDEDDTLTKLELQSLSIDENDLTTLLEPLKNSKIVKELNLSNNESLDDHSVGVLCDIISSCKSLNKIYLEGTLYTKISTILHAIKITESIEDATLPEAATEDELDLLDAILEERERKD
ncbi:LRR receptor-like serine/threonine-protein kinase [Acrasis kona]|uniref:LRR receptor-like serine/threonine-protein kinase n=1 Tax=Acrasis kona TaxID=1008807 RepID=A0AAW2ZHA0_9EUKA